jgi:hypothetical protein
MAMTDVYDTAAARMRGMMQTDDGAGADLWDPQPGEFLIAEFRHFESRYSKKMNDDVRVAIVRELDTNKLFAIWLSREVLRSEFERKSPREGDIVGVKYFGRKKNADGTDGYHRYSLEVDRLGRAPVSAPPDGETDVDEEDDDSLPF